MKKYGFTDKLILKLIGHLALIGAPYGLTKAESSWNFRDYRMTLTITER